MPQGLKQIIGAVLVCTALVISPAKAEVSVSLSISGDPSELMAILNLLRQEGFGTESIIEGDDPLKIRVESFGGQEDGLSGESVEEIMPLASPAELPPPTPLLLLANPIVTPNTVAPGATALVSLALIDERSAVDTIAMTFEGKSFDLSDTGDQGDQIAGDGIWSTEVPVPETLEPGSYALGFTAFDAHGMPVIADESGDSPVALTATTSLVVQK